MKHFLFSLLCLLSFALLAQDHLQVNSFNADSMGLAKGTAVSILPRNGGYIRASSGTISNTVFGLLPADGPVGANSQVLIYGLLSLSDWTGIVGQSDLQANAYYYLSATPGKISTNSSGVSQIVGRALSTTAFLVNPQLLNTNGASATLTSIAVISPIQATTNAGPLYTIFSDNWTNNDSLIGQGATNNDTVVSNGLFALIPATSGPWTNDALGNIFPVGMNSNGPVVINTNFGRMALGLGAGRDILTPNRLTFSMDSYVQSNGPSSWSFNAGSTYDFNTGVKSLVSMFGDSSNASSGFTTCSEFLIAQGAFNSAFAELLTQNGNASTDTNSFSKLVLTDGVNGQMITIQSSPSLPFITKGDNSFRLDANSIWTAGGYIATGLWKSPTNAPAVGQFAKATTTVGDSSWGNLSANDLPVAVLTNDTRVLTFAGPIFDTNLTASRLVLSDANRQLTSAAASGAVPVDADGSATTFAQVNTLAPAYIVTNNNANALVLSNTLKLDAAHALSLSNATVSHVLQVGADSTVSSVSSGAVPIDGDGSATTFAQVNALAPGYLLTNGNSSAFTQSNNMSVDPTHIFYAADTSNTVVWATANYVVLSTDQFVLITGNHTTTMPSASANGVVGKWYWVQCTSAGTNAILRNGSDTFNGNFGQALTKLTNTAVGKAIMLFSNGTNWWYNEF